MSHLPGSFLRHQKDELLAQSVFLMKVSWLGSSPSTRKTHLWLHCQLSRKPFLWLSSLQWSRERRHRLRPVPLLLVSLLWVRTKVATSLRAHIVETGLRKCLLIHRFFLSRFLLLPAVGRISRCRDHVPCPRFL